MPGPDRDGALVSVKSCCSTGMPALAIGGGSVLMQAAWLRCPWTTCVFFFVCVLVGPDFQNLRAVVGCPGFVFPP